MLNEICPKTGCVGIPLMKNRDPARPIALCVHCNSEFTIGSDGTIAAAAAASHSAPSTTAAVGGMTVIADVPRQHPERRAPRSPPAPAAAAAASLPASPTITAPQTLPSPPATTTTTTTAAASSTPVPTPSNDTFTTVKTRLTAKIDETSQYLAALHPPHQLDDMTKTAAALTALLQAYHQI